MNPEKERPCRLLVEPGEGTIHHFLATPFQADVAVLAPAPPMKPRIVSIKSAFETWSQFPRIEHQRSYKCCRPVSVSVKNVGKKRESFAERVSHIVHMIEPRVGSGEDCSVRGGRQGHLGVGSRKDHAPPGQSIQIRRKPAFGAEETHAIGTGGVQGDQYNIGTRRGGRIRRCRCRRTGACCQQHRPQPAPRNPRFRKVRSLPPWKFIHNVFLVNHMQAPAGN